jgi:hypothetical protein
VRLYASDEPDAATGLPRPQVGFRLASVDLFALGRIAKKFYVLAEMAAEVNQFENWEFDVERLQLAYRFRDWLTVTAGRMHTNLGYYNTAFHHGSWLETPIARPRVVAFEDHGGLLPVHLIGLSLSGHLLRDKTDFGYALEVGNGRSELSTDVVQFQEKSLFKAVNAQVYLRFPRIGLRLGANALVDQAPPAADLATYPLRTTAINELIIGGHLVWQLSGFELLAEYYFIRHVVDGSDNDSKDHGYYALMSYQVRNFRPFLLAHGAIFDQDVPDLFYSPTGAPLATENTLGGGLKWWLGDRLSLKLQYEHKFSMQDVNVGTLQAAFGI